MRVGERGAHAERHTVAPFTHFVTSRSHMRVAIRYVLENHAKHMRQVGKQAPAIDSFSSAVCGELVCEGQSRLIRSAFS